MLAKTSAHRSYSARNRPVTACSECIRRKQKCDRSLPCQRCVARRVESKCSYQSVENAPNPSYPIKRRKISSRDTTPDHDVQISSLLGPELSERIGYSRNGVNALTDLDQLLEGSPVSSKPPDKLNTLPSSQWVDYMRIIQNLPRTEHVQQLVEVFFNEANWYFAVLDRYYFDAMHFKWIAFRCRSKTDAPISLEVSHFGALLLQVIALTLQFLPSGHSCEDSLCIREQKERDDMSVRLSGASDALMNLLDRRQPTITSVQTDLMRCAWLKNDGRGAEAWNSLGNAVRQAQELGLHLRTNFSSEPSHMTSGDRKALWYDEHKRRLWVTLFVWESHMSLQLGRPRLINASDCTLANPIDRDFPLEPSCTLFALPEPEDRPSFYTVQLVKYKVSLAIHRMMSTITLNASLQDYSIIESFQKDISDILRNLPPAMQLERPDNSWDLLYPGLVKQRLQISIVVHSFLVALHRPYASEHIISRQHAIDAALRSLDASQELFERSEPHHFKIYTLVFHTIDSGIFLAATAIKRYTSPSETRQRIFRTLEQAVNRLGVLKARNPAAKYGESVLAKCVKSFCKSWTEQNEPYFENLSESSIFKISGLSDSAANSEAVTRPRFNTESTTPIPTTGYDPSLGRDLFSEIINAELSTASWLENANIMSMLELRFDESDYTWDTHI